jgi:Proteasome activator pa28 beta subunit
MQTLLTHHALCHSRQDFKTKGKAEALDLLNRSVANLQALQALYVELFPYAKLSDSQVDFKAVAASANNEKVNKALDSTLNQLDATNQTARTLEYFIMLHIPKIEDGGNFGVGVQLDLVKKLSEMQDSMKSAIEDLLGYQSARAEALGKLNLPSTSTTVTKSSGATTTDGKTEEKTSEITENKESTSLAAGPMYESRLAAVAAVDTLYYSKAKGYFQSCKFQRVRS